MPPAITTTVSRQRMLPLSAKQITATPFAAATIRIRSGVIDRSSALVNSVQTASIINPTAPPK